MLRMRIQEGAAGYRVYMMLLETLRDADGRRVFNFPEGLAFAINEKDIDLVKRVIENYGLFNEDKEGFITSPWLDAQMAEYDAKKAAAAEAGRRGAAKRYGKKPEAAPENSEQAGETIATPKAPNSNKPNPNIINSTEINPTTTKSRLLELSWGGYKGEDIFKISRERGTALSPMDTLEAMQAQKDAIDKGDNEHNYPFVLECAQDFGFNHEQYLFLREVTNNGQCGTPIMRELVRIHRAWKSNEFRAKYPFDYTICKLLDPQ